MSGVSRARFVDDSQGVGPLPTLVIKSGSNIALWLMMAVFSIRMRFQGMG